MTRLINLAILGISIFYSVLSFAQSEWPKKEQRKFSEDLRLIFGQIHEDGTYHGEWYSYYSPKNINKHSGTETPNIMEIDRGSLSIIFLLGKCDDGSFNIWNHYDSVNIENEDFSVPIEFAIDKKRVIKGKVRVLRAEGEKLERLIFTLDNENDQRLKALMRTGSILRTKIHWPQGNKEYGRYSLVGFTKSFKHAKSLCVKNSDSYYFD